MDKMEDLKNSRWFWCLGLFIVLVLLDKVAFAGAKEWYCGEPKTEIVYREKPLKVFYYKFVTDDRNTPDVEDDIFLIYETNGSYFKQVAIVNGRILVLIDGDMDEVSRTKFKDEDTKQEAIEEDFGELLLIKWKTKF